MSDSDAALRRTANVAALGSAALIAQQVGSKAARDALFLSSFDVTSLPLMLGAAAAISVVGSLLIARAMSRVGPQRLVPAAFFTSAVLLLLEWLAASALPRVVAVVFFIHVAGFGLILISGFWSLLSERFDPRSAKAMLGRIAMAGTVGGLVGGLLAERIAATLGLLPMLPVLAGLTAAAGVTTLRIRGPATSRAVSMEESSGVAVLRRVPYLRHLAMLVLLGTIAATFLDYVFKARAAASLADGDELLRFFAVFYTAAAFLTMVVQGGFGRRVLQTWGIVPAVLALPAGVVGGSLVALAAPGLAAAAIARGTESVLRSSLYRGGYEALFAPLRTAEKRATKSIIDVGFDRLGDGLGAAAVLGLLALGTYGEQAMLSAAALLGLASVFVALKLRAGYVAALERSLREMSLEVEALQEMDEATQHILTVTLKSSYLSDFGQYIDKLRTTAQRLPPVAKPPSTEASSAPMSAEARLLEDLRSGDVDRVLQSLTQGRLDDSLIPAAVGLLGWDDVAPAVTAALMDVSEEAVPAARDALLDPDEVFAVRRRVAAILGAAANPESVNALLTGLSDPRFAVRFRCGRALRSAVEAHPELAPDSGLVHEVVIAEVARQRKVWKGQRLLDAAGESPFVSDVLSDRADRGLEHVVTLLSLVLETEPLVIAYHALHTDDRMLKGTALEYLEHVLPESVRTVLWPFLEADDRRDSGDGRTDQEVLDSLLNSHRSIVMHLESAKVRGAAATVLTPTVEEGND